VKKRWWPPFVVLFAGFLAALPLREHLAASAIAARSPEQAGLAALFLLALYGIKGLSLAFPLAILEAAGGMLFPFFTALAVNTCGVLLAQALPYCLGRREQSQLSALTARYPRLSRLRPTVHPGRAVFLLRLAGAAPGDLVSLYLGAAGIPPQAYLLGGVLGSFPRVAAATLLGTALWDIGSPRFWLALLPGAGLTALSLFLWSFWHLQQTQHGSQPGASLPDAGPQSSAI